MHETGVNTSCERSGTSAGDDVRSTSTALESYAMGDNVTSLQYTGSDIAGLISHG